MKFLYTLLILLCMCGNHALAQRKPPATPLDYNDRLAEVTDSLYHLGIEWGSAFRKIYTGDKDFSRLSAQRKQLQAFVSRKITEVRALPAIGKGAAVLKEAMIEFLFFENRMIETAFFPMERFTGNSSGSEIEAAVKLLQSEADKEGKELTKVHTAQKYYAAQNDFELESREDQE